MMSRDFGALHQNKLEVDFPRTGGFRFLVRSDELSCILHWGCRSWQIVPTVRAGCAEVTAPFFQNQNQNLYKRSDKLAKTNFQYEKRQKDLEKKRKKEEKLKKKLDRNSQPEENPEQPAADEAGPVPDQA